MSKLMYIQASPRGERSYSVRLCRAFLETYTNTHPDDKIETVDLFTYDLPTFDGLAVQAKYTILHNQDHSAEELSAWKAVEKVIAEFKSADKYLLAVPMWNFGIPYRLKQYFDVIVQPGYTFSFSPEEGYRGLVTNKPVCIACSRGGEYPYDSPMDFQKKYLEAILGFIGFTNIQSVIVEPTLAGGLETAQKKLIEAMNRAKTIAEAF
jgi:FMN-dependent NADH-azoreductase